MPTFFLPVSMFSRLSLPQCSCFCAIWEGGRTLNTMMMAIGEGGRRTGKVGRKW